MRAMFAVRWLLRACLVGLLGLILAAVAVLIVIPRATHGAALTVLTGSMTPHIPVGSVVIDRPVDPGTLHVGDIATYQKAPGVNEYITHRVVRIDTSKSPTMFTFKGDANRGPDVNPVPATAIRGKVWFHVPYLGAIRDAIHTKGGIAGIGVILIAIYAMVQLAGGLKERRSAKIQAVGDLADTVDAAAPVEVVAGPATAALATVVRERLQSGKLGADSPMVMLATLPTSQFDGISPAVVSRLLRGTLIETTETTFTILTVEDPRRSGDTVVFAHEVAHPALYRMLEELAPTSVVPASTAEVSPADDQASGAIDLLDPAPADDVTTDRGDLVVGHV